MPMERPLSDSEMQGTLKSLETSRSIQRDPSRSRKSPLIRYVASALFALAVIAAGVKFAIDHWPCELAPNADCSPTGSLAQQAKSDGP